MSRRHYSDDERATALAALDANGGNIKGTARALGIPEKTLAGWAKGRGVGPAGADLRAQKRGPMADALESVAWQLLDALPDKIEGATLSQAATSMAIAIDKARLLRGEPTSITSGDLHHEFGLTAADIAAAEALAAASYPGVPADGGAQPVAPLPAAPPAAAVPLPV